MIISFMAHECREHFPVNDNAEHTRSRVHVPVNDNARMRMLNILVHGCMFPLTIMRHKLINECTRPTQHIINVKKNIKETVNIALSI